jgi:hypothetical protein
MTELETTVDEILREVELHIQAAHNGRRMAAEVGAGLTSVRRTIEVILHQRDLELDTGVRAELHDYFDEPLR